ncbi:MAG: SdrD B-like domain-containing protein, partial [Melioribacteraceae bacterium]
MNNLYYRFSTILLTTILLFSFSSNVNARGGEKENNGKKLPTSYFSNSGMMSVTGANSTTVAKVFGQDKKVNVKFPNPDKPTETISTSAGNFYGDVDGNSGYFYCVDIHHYIKYYTADQPHTYKDDGAVDPKIIYIINNYFPYKAYPYTGSASTAQIEAAAVQIALWHFSDDVDANKVDNTSVKTRALQIISDAEANYSSYQPFETLLIVPGSQDAPTGKDATFYVSAFDANGNPLSGITVTLSASNGTLSSTTAVTDTDGNTPEIKLTQGGDIVSEITASASVLLAPGVRYVHSVEPNTWQKLVLATPSGVTKKSTATINWFVPANCVIKGFTTYTQGGWGNKNGTPGKIRDKNFSSVFPNDLIIGSTYKLTLTSSSKVKDFLPSGGTPGKFTENYKDVSSTNAGVFAGQMVALKLNLEFDKAGVIGTNSVDLGELQIAKGPFSGKTVNQFYALAETAIGGGALNGFTYSEFSDAATAINENFDNGTTDKGFLTCAAVNVKASIGDFVWLDTNKDGIQGDTEYGFGAVIVNLYNCNDELISSTQTTLNGGYAFVDLNPGDYYVQFILPTGYLFSPANVGNDLTKNSDAEISSGKTICTTLTAGENDITWDAGIYKEDCKSSIGDFVWHDINVNGIQDSGEPGIKDVVVELYSGDNVIATSITDANGFYQFSNLANGTYKVKVAKSNYEKDGVLYNTAKTKWYASPKDKGNNDLKDSDASKDEAVTVTLNCGSNASIDFGFYFTCVTITKSADIKTAKPGDKITYTFTVENCGDIQHHGGIDIFDRVINSKSPYLIKHIDKLDPGKSTSFTAEYTAKESDCGDLINEVTAEAHPVDGSAYVTDKATATVNIDCSTPCTDSWSLEIDKNKEVCEHNPVDFTINGKATINPKPSKGYLVTSWKVAFPNDGSVDNSSKIDTIEISNDKEFQIVVKWPGVRSEDTRVEIQYTVSVLDCNKNELNKPYEGKISWTPAVCPPPPGKDADLKIEKTSSIENPQCGDNVTYTIKVTNLGPGESKAVRVLYLLPAGITYLSHTVSQGTYNNTSGLWEVNDLAVAGVATLTISIKADCEEINSAAFDLGAAIDYNLFVIQDLVQPSSDTEGKVAVGRDATLGRYSVGDKLNTNSGDVLVVGRDLVYTSGRVFNGNVVYGNTTNLPLYVTSIDGELRNDNPINFVTAKTYLENLSTKLSSYPATGTSELAWSTLKLTGTDPHLNVFTVDGKDLSDALTLEIHVPNGAVALVNVNGTGMDWSGGLDVYGTTYNNILYNFFEATAIDINNIEVRGSVLAPFAAINFASGVQYGQMICKSLTGQGQFNLFPFHGNIPSNKTIVNIASITGSLTNDPNTANNNSSSVFVMNNSNANPNDGNSGTGEAGGQWEEVGSFNSGEIILTMAFDNSNTYAGTVGGKINKSTDGGKTWTRVNDDMSVGWVWSLVHHNNVLFAATEKGVYKYEGSNWKLTALSGKEVRAIATNGNTLYAGTWGYGVFKSIDNGDSWFEYNNELSDLAVQALAVDKKGNLFAGTGSLGIFKVFTGEDRWYQYSIGNNSIWAIGVSENAVIASCYGGGVYVSTDNGSNWQKSPLQQNYIYSLVTDKSNKVFASSWTSGVFVTTDEGSSWQQLGMGGFGVSSMVTSPSKDDLFAG